MKLMLYLTSALRLSATWTSRAGNEAQRFSTTTGPSVIGAAPVLEHDQRWKWVPA